MSIDIQKTARGLLLGALLFGGILPSVWAGPFANVGPDQALYQRVRALGASSLLDPADRRMLEEGRIVTRLELAFVLAKAADRLEKEPLVLAATAATDAKKSAGETKAGSSKQEILELLGLLREESSLLRTRLSLDDARIREQTAVLEKLNAAQEKIDLLARGSNRMTGSPHFTSISSLRVENLRLRGIDTMDATRVVNELNLGMWSDLGGKGSLSFGLGGYQSSSNASAGPVSIYLFSPKVTYNLDGGLGHWTAAVAVEDYNYDTDLGTFTRGVSPGGQRYESPFEIKKWSGDKNTKTWEDYMSSLSYVPSSVSWASQGNTTRVFDGVYLLGSRLPLVGQDARATLLVGRMGSSGLANRWEEAFKIRRPWANGLLQTSLSALWVNDHLGVEETGTPCLDMKSYSAEVGIDLKPVFLSLEGGASRFFTGVDLAAEGDPEPIKANAGQASINLYPLTFNVADVGEGYSNFQSKVVVTGLDYTRFGFPAGYGGGLHPNSTVAEDNQGKVGMANDLLSNRRGWRVNLGWKGRQESWMRNWPEILDDLLLNFDVAGKKEYKALLSGLQGYTATDVSGGAAYNFISASNMLSVYVPEDTGLWGNNTWFGYSATRHAGEIYTRNLQALRNDANWDGTDPLSYAFVTRFNGSTVNERIPLMLPVIDPGTGQVAVDAGGRNLYTQLDHRKSFHYLTLTGKLRFNKWLGRKRPFYGGFFYTDHRVSGETQNPALTALDDPLRPGETLEKIPELFRQRVMEASLMFQVVKNVNLMGNAGLETWKSDYTYPRVEYRTESFGLGAAYDLPWGGGKLEARYKHLAFTDRFIPASDYRADQVYTYFMFQF